MQLRPTAKPESLHNIYCKISVKFKLQLRWYGEMIMIKSATENTESELYSFIKSISLHGFYCSAFLFFLLML